MEIRRIPLTKRDQPGLSPETTGSPSQFGDFRRKNSELSQDIPGVGPCIDFFSPVYLRSISEFNTYDDFASALQLVKDSLGEEALKTMHIHLSGIEYGPEASRKHLI